jgi:hypothetical protein
MLSDLERMILVALTGVVLVGGCVKLSIDDQTAKKIEEEKRKELVSQEQGGTGELSSPLMPVTSTLQINPPSFEQPNCNNNSGASLCTMHIVPIDPTPAERSMQNGMFRR